MTVNERAIVFDCAGELLVGVLAAPVAMARIGVVVVVGGPQTRVGSHRYFVHLARALALAGYPTLRFDCRGMGDSTGVPRSFERISEDIGAAISAVQGHAPDVRHVVLWGLCDGASAALLYLNATGDPRVVGLCLINPWVRSVAGLARTHVKHYYLQRLLHREFWLKLVSGKVTVGAVTGLWNNISAAFGGGAADELGYQKRMASALAAFAGPVLLLLSENDYTAREFVEFTRADPAWTEALTRPRLQQHVLPGADHTFSDPAVKKHVQCMLEAWLSDESAALADLANHPRLEMHDAR